VLGLVSVALSVIGPKILGHATDLIFTGLIGGRLPAGATKAQAVARLRVSGQDRIADMVAAMDVLPGRGVDFHAVGLVLLGVLVLYVAASVLSWFQGRVTTIIVQRTVYGMRADVEAKFSRMPLSYFDSKPRGELLSRVTNDIDNIAQSLQQTMSQLLTSLLTVIGVLAMMVYVSPVLALVALVTVPASMFITMTIAKRSQPQFVRQWATTGKLNGHVEEAYTGHELVKVFGRTDETVAEFRKLNEELYTSSFKAREKRELIDLLEPYRTHERGSGEASRWKSDEELVWEGLRPELVCEVAFDHITGRRIRHGARFLRWRDDKEPEECTIDDLRS